MPVWAVITLAVIGVVALDAALIAAVSARVRSSMKTGPGADTCRPFWERIAPLYDPAMQRFSAVYDQAAQRIAPYLAPETAAEAESNVLEIGASSGQLTGRLASRSSSWTATDVAQAMLDELSENIDAPNIVTQQADARKLPFEKGSFDAVVAGSVLRLVPDPARALQEVRRVLVPGGVFLVAEFVRPDNARRSDGLLVGLARLLGMRIPNDWNAQELDSALAAVGFAVQDTFDVSGGPLPLHVVIAYPHKDG